MGFLFRACPVTQANACFCVTNGQEIIIIILSKERVHKRLIACTSQYKPTVKNSRHSSIQDFEIKNISVYSPIEPWHTITTCVYPGIASLSELQ